MRPIQTPTLKSGHDEDYFWVLEINKITTDTTTDAFFLFLSTQFLPFSRQIPCDTIRVGIVSLYKVVKAMLRVCSSFVCFNIIKQWNPYTTQLNAHGFFFSFLIYKWKQTYFHMFSNLMLHRMKNLLMFTERVLANYFHKRSFYTCC